MPTFRVECIGESRELYLVEADDEDHAKSIWFAGQCTLQESSSMEPINAEKMP